MRRTILPVWFLVGAVLTLTLLATASTPLPAAAQSPGYTLTWSVVAGGGGMNLAGGGYTLGATLGQYEAGSQSQGADNLDGGFWVDLFGFRLFLPALFR